MVLAHNFASPTTRKIKIRKKRVERKREEKGKIVRKQKKRKMSSV